MATNTSITTAKVAVEALDVLSSKCPFIMGMKRDYSEEFRQKMAGDIGYTVSVKRPPRFTVGTGPAADPQAITQTYVPVTISYQKNVATSMITASRTLEFSKVREDTIEPIMTQIAAELDKIALQEMYKAVFNFSAPSGGLGVLDGATSTANQAVTTIGIANQILSEAGAPEDGRVAVVAPKVNTALVSAYSSLFNPQDDGARRFREGYMGTALGFEFARDVAIPTLTNGTLNTTGATGASAQGGSNTQQSDATTPFSLTIAAPSATIKVGQVVTIANLYAVHPQIRESLGRLQTFTVVGNGTVGTDVGASDTTMQIIPYPIFSGQFQNVYSATGAIAASSTITSVSGLNSASYSQNLFFHPNAFQLVTARPYMPPNVDGAFRYSAKTGLSVRVIMDEYSALTDQCITRFDVLAGFKAVNPEMAVRISG